MSATNRLAYHIRGADAHRPRIKGRKPISRELRIWPKNHGLFWLNMALTIVATNLYILCLLLNAKWAVSFCWLPPVLTSNCDGDLKRHSMSA